MGNARIVRALGVSGSAVAFATGNSVYIGGRRLLTLDEYCRNRSRGQDEKEEEEEGDHEDERRRIKVELRLDGGHRREVNVFQIDPETGLLVAAGR